MSTIDNGLYPRVSRGFGKYSVTHLILFFRNLIAMINSNPAYPKPAPTIEVFTTAVNDLDVKAQTAMNGGKVEIAARRASQAAALSLARQLANYVEGNCGNDIETLLSSGFDAIKAPTPPVTPVTPGNPRLEYNGTSGTLVFRFTRGRNVKNFSVQHSENVDGPWTDHPLSTSTRVRLEELTPGKTYWARSRANGTAGSSDWTVPTSKMAI